MARYTGSVSSLVMPWVEIDRKVFEGSVKALLLREELTLPINEQLIADLYSK